MYRRNAWTESFITWSPRGTMIATVHRQGVALWGGPGWAKLHRFQHVGVRLIDFSPCERFLVSYSLQARGTHIESACTHEDQHTCGFSI